MLDRESRIKVNEFLAQKEELKGKIKDNNLEIRRLKDMFMLEQKADRSAQIKRDIRFGERLVSTQKTELNGLSITRIAEKTGLTVLQVRHQTTTFNACNVIL